MSKIEKIMENMSLEDKISQTAVELMQKGVKAKCKPGAAFFFGQIITEADEAGIDEQRGFNVSFYEGADKFDRVMDEFYEKNDLVIYACFSRPFRPIGFIDYTGARACQIVHCFKPKDAVRKNVIASFGSPYFGNQYFEKAKTYVNAYSMLSCSAEAFAKATCGEIDFKGKSPVKL